MCIIHTVNNFEDAKKLIDENPNCIILDVREEEEYATGHVKDAVLFPVDDITAESAKEVIPSIRKIGKYDINKPKQLTLPKPKEHKIIKKYYNGVPVMSVKDLGIRFA